MTLAPAPFPGTRFLPPNPAKKKPPTSRGPPPGPPGGGNVGPCTRRQRAQASTLRLGGRGVPGAFFSPNPVVVICRSLVSGDDPDRVVWVSSGSVRRCCVIVGRAVVGWVTGTMPSVSPRTCRPPLSREALSQCFRSLRLVHWCKVEMTRVQPPLTWGKGPHRTKPGDSRPPSRGVGCQYPPQAGKLGVCNTMAPRCAGSRLRRPSAERRRRELCSGWFSALRICMGRVPHLSPSGVGHMHAMPWTRT